jgi:hypothetical protein
MTKAGVEPAFIYLQSSAKSRSTEEGPGLTEPKSPSAYIGLFYP